MTIGSALNSGVQGFLNAQQGVSEASLNINRRAQQERNVSNEQEDVRRAQDQAQTNASQDRLAQPVESIEPAEQVTAPSLTQSAVELRVEERNAEANARSIQTADEVLGSIIDIRV